MEKAMELGTVDTSSDPPPVPFPGMGSEYESGRDKDADSPPKGKSYAQLLAKRFHGVPLAELLTPHYIPEHAYSKGEPTCPEKKKSNDLYTQKLARTALNYYNKKHDKQYQFVESLGSFSFSDADGIWAHCNFKAESKGEIKVFFAEQKTDPGGPGVTACCALDGKKTTKGCELCACLLHPTRRFRKGFPKHQSRRMTRSVKTCNAYQ